MSFVNRKRKAMTAEWFFCAVFLLFVCAVEAVGVNEREQFMSEKTQAIKDVESVRDILRTNSKYGADGVLDQEELKTIASVSDSELIGGMVENFGACAGLSDDGDGGKGISDADLVKFKNALSSFAYEGGDDSSNPQESSRKSLEELQSSLGQMRAKLEAGAPFSASKNQVPSVNVSAISQEIDTVSAGLEQKGDLLSQQGDMASRAADRVTGSIVANSAANGRAMGLHAQAANCAKLRSLFSIYQQRLGSSAGYSDLNGDWVYIDILMDPDGLIDSFFYGVTTLQVSGNTLIANGQRLSLSVSSGEYRFVLNGENDRSEYRLSLVSSQCLYGKRYMQCHDGRTFVWNSYFLRRDPLVDQALSFGNF